MADDSRTPQPDGTSPHEVTRTRQSSPPEPPPTERRVGVVVPAAGIGQRLGDHRPKALVPLAGKVLLHYVLADLEATACVGAVVVTARPDMLEAIGALVGTHGFTRVTAIVPGGPTRQASVATGLRALPVRPDLVAVHDAARPLAGPGLLDTLLEQLLSDREGCCGVVPGVPVTDTIREIDQTGRSKGLVPRERLRGMQTPQLFWRAALEKAHALAAADGFEGTDEAALVERAGETIRLASGAVENLKITTPLDLVVATALLARRGGSAVPSSPSPSPTGAGRTSS